MYLSCTCKHHTKIVMILKLAFKKGFVCFSGGEGLFWEFCYVCGFMWVCLLFFNDWDGGMASNYIMLNKLYLFLNNW